MAGNREGGLKAAQKNKASNPNFYRDLGKRTRTERLRPEPRTGAPSRLKGWLNQPTPEASENRSRQRGSLI